MDETNPITRLPTSRRLTVFAQDPGVTVDGKALTTRVEVPADTLFPGPRSSRIQIVDYDATTEKFYGSHVIGDEDIFADETNVSKLVGDPKFHAQNVYGVVASTVYEFEKALGRNLSWGFSDKSHQLKIFPHAFLEPNAFYSQKDECIAFGYFPKNNSKKEHVFTCLSHDIIAHETAHALLDGLRSEFMRPASADQAAFHEGFADIIALLKILKSENLINLAVKSSFRRNSSGTVDVEKAMAAIKNGNFLLGLAEEVGQSLHGLGRNALRQYENLNPDKSIYSDERFLEPHIRGEILVGAVMSSYLAVWEKRLRGKLDAQLGNLRPKKVAIWRIAEEGAKAAGHLLHMVIRAIDYMPPVNINFGDFLSAILTADWQIYPADRRGRYGYRDELLKAFGAYGIEPSSQGFREEPGVWWAGVDESLLRFNMSNIDSMRWSREAMFKFIWENYEALGLVRDMFTRVHSVRPVWRVGPEGFVLRETVVEYYQLLNEASVADLRALSINPPDGMKASDTIKLVAGGTLIFDEFGRLKFHIHNRVTRRKINEDGTRELNSIAIAKPNSEMLKSFDGLHRCRAHGSMRKRDEEWS